MSLHYVESGVSRTRSERGAALIEMALTLPLLLLVTMGAVEFGRAYQHWQVLTNAAREGARIAVLPGVDGKQNLNKSSATNRRRVTSTVGGDGDAQRDDSGRHGRGSRTSGCMWQ
jgi:Flp pilus assembly protein TadG